MINFIDKELDDCTRNILNSIYNSRDRYYHDYAHINDMLILLDELIKVHPEIAEEIDYIVLRQGIIFHDVVQFTSYNERKSSEFTEYILKGLFYSESTIDEICCLITVTDHIAFKDSSDMNLAEKLIRDLDLKGLGADWATYRHNGYLIRKENPVPENQFLKGRKKFLEYMLSYDKIYSTKYFAHLEEKARANIQRELDDIHRILC